MDDVSGGSVNPLADVIYAGVCADGFYQACGGGDDAFGLLDDEFEGGTKGEIALLEKVQGARVAVNGCGTASRVELTVNEPDIAPLTKSFFDGFVLGMVADGAAAFVVR